MISYAKQSIDEEDVQHVVEVLTSDFLTQGPQVPAFESAVAKYCGAAHAVAVNSATSALHLACLALGLSEGDIGWTVPLTFVASANAFRYCGAKVDFVDVNASNGLICVDALKAKLQQAHTSGCLPRVLTVVHYAGSVCDMQRIHELCDQYSVKIIEDASHAIGARYKGLPVGQCQFSDICVFSFHPVKIITSAEGGMLTCKEQSLADKLIALRGHGIYRSHAAQDEPWLYEQMDLGFNYRMSDIHAALGLSQLGKIDQFIKRRNEQAAFYHEKLSHLPLTLLQTPEGVYSAWHLYVVRVNNASRVARKELFSELAKVGIRPQVHYIPVHTQPYYQALGFSWGDYPNAEAFYNSCITIPLYPSLSGQEQNYVIEQLTRILVKETNL